MVKDLKQKIASANSELESGQFEITGAEKPMTSETREALKKELDKIIGNEAELFASGKEKPIEANDAIYKLLLMDKVDSTLAQDMDVNKSIYNMLLQKLETAKITQRLETSKEGTRYTIIDPPLFPLRPVKPNKILMAFMGLFLGTGAGAGLAFAREFLDRSYIDVEDAKHRLDLPVLGAISRIVTVQEGEKERNKNIMIIMTITVISVLFVVGSMLFAAFKAR